METYIYILHSTFIYYIATRLIIDFCLEAEQSTCLRVPRRWWEQEGVDFTCLRKAMGDDRDGDRTGEG